MSRPARQPACAGALGHILALRPVCQASLARGMGMLDLPTRKRTASLGHDSRRSRSVTGEVASAAVWPCDLPRSASRPADKGPGTARLWLDVDAGRLRAGWRNEGRPARVPMSARTHAVAGTSHRDRDVAVADIRNRGRENARRGVRAMTGPGVCARPGCGRPVQARRKGGLAGPAGSPRRWCSRECCAHGTSARTLRWRALRRAGGLCLQCGAAQDAADGRICLRCADLATAAVRARTGASPCRCGRCGGEGHNRRTCARRAGAG